MIRFPGLGIALEANQIALEIAGIKIYSYAFCIVFGIVFAILLAYFSKERFNIKFEFLFETLIQAIITGVIGARIYYVIFNLDYYITYPLQVLNLRNGGLAVYGGLIVGLLLILKKCKEWNVNKLDFLDYIAPFVALAQSIGRWGNFFNQEAYGIETKSIFRMGIETASGYIEVHPVFLYESFATLVIFMILRSLQANRKFRGEIAYLYLFLYSWVRMILEGLRIDSLMFNNFRISQILSVAIFVVSGSLLLKNYTKYRKNHN